MTMTLIPRAQTFPSFLSDELDAAGDRRPQRRDADADADEAEEEALSPSSGYESLHRQ